MRVIEKNRSERMWTTTKMKEFGQIPLNFESNLNICFGLECEVERKKMSFRKSK